MYIYYYVVVSKLNTSNFVCTYFVRIVFSRFFFFFSDFVFSICCWRFSILELIFMFDFDFCLTVLSNITAVTKNPALWSVTFPSLSTLWREHSTNRGRCKSLRWSVIDLDFCGLTLLGPQSRFGDKLLIIRVNCPHIWECGAKGVKVFLLKVLRTPPSHSSVQLWV